MPACRLLCTSVHAWNTQQCHDKAFFFSSTILWICTFEIKDLRGSLFLPVVYSVPSTITLLPLYL